MPNFKTTSLNGTTSGTPSTYTQVVASKSREGFYIENPSTNTGSIDVAFGESGSEAIISKLDPGQGIGFSGYTTPPERIAVRSTVASQTYYALEY